MADHWRWALRGNSGLKSRTFSEWLFHWRGRMHKQLLTDSSSIIGWCCFGETNSIFPACLSSGCSCAVGAVDLRVGGGNQERKAGQHLRQPQFGLIVVVQSLSHTQLFSTPWTAALQICRSLTISPSLPKFMSIESVITSHCAGYPGKIIIIPPFTLRGSLLCMIYVATPVREGTNANSDMCGPEPVFTLLEFSLSTTVAFLINHGALAWVRCRPWAATPLLPRT